MKLYIIALLLSTTTFTCIAQSSQKIFLGPGIGLDYGGLGIRGEIQPYKSIGIFIGAGYNLAEPAYNAGASCKLVTPADCSL